MAYFRITLLLLLQCICLSVFSQKPKVTYESVLVEKDVVVDGAKGIRVKGKCNFQAYRTNYSTDSLMYRAFLGNAFYLSITPYVSDTSIIQPAFGYSLVFPDEKLFVKRKIKPTLNEVKAGLVDFSWFVPYAAMKLHPTQQELNYTMKFYGKDGFNNVVSGDFKTTKTAFEKPKTRVFEVHLDSIIVKPVDNQGQVWDLGFLDEYAKPDLKWFVKLGGEELNAVQKMNTYELDYSDKPKVFSFVISENDEVLLYLVDVDEYMDDSIASWKLNSSNMKEGKIYKQEEAKANLKAFGFSFKAGVFK